MKVDTNQRKWSYKVFELQLSFVRSISLPGVSSVLFCFVFLVSMEVCKELSFFVYSDID